jgi:hypothetical protein
MRNATSKPPSEDASADLHKARRGCGELGQQVEALADQFLPVLKQAAQELARLEAQRDELRKTASREVPPAILPRLLERIEEHAQHVKRLERTSRGLQELHAALGGMDELLRGGLARQDLERGEQEALIREEKRLWLRELLSLRQRAGAASAAADKPRSGEVTPPAEARDDAERERLARRVEELERTLAEREQTLAAKEQTLADLRRMIVLLTGPTAAGVPQGETLPPPLAVPPLAPAPREVASVRSSLRTPPSAGPRPSAQQMFGERSMDIAHGMLDNLGTEAESPPPRVPSMEIMLGPLDELETAGPATSPPVPAVAPGPPQPALPRAGARMPSTIPPTPPEARPGTLVISEDMFNDMLVDDNPPGGGTGRK